MDDELESRVSILLSNARLLYAGKQWVASAFTQNGSLRLSRPGNPHGVEVEPKHFSLVTAVHPDNYEDWSTE